MKRIISLLLVLAMVLSLAACGDNGVTPVVSGDQGGQNEVVPVNPEEVVEVEGDYIYKDAVITLATNWNPHTYQTADDLYPQNYTTDSLYTLIFNDARHPVEGKEPFEGYMIVPAMAADYPVDVTESVKAEHPEFNIPESATSGFAWSVKLRDDLKWDDGTPITANDFVGSLERVLRPELLNYRAADYYEGTYAVVNGKNYALAGHASYLDNGIQGVQIEEMTKNEEGQYTYDDGKLVYIAVDYSLDWLGGDTLAAYVDAYGADMFGMDNWDALLALADQDGLVPCTDDNLALLSSVTTANPAWGESDAALFNYLALYESSYDADYDFSNVGLYAPADDELVFVYSSSLEGFYLMTYGMNVPLVKIDLYDSLLKEEQTASGSVWSSTYCTNVETSCSYGPYKVSDYQLDKSMHFVKNENWAGWNYEWINYVDPEDGLTYQMYQTTEIDTQVVSEPSTQKQMFLSGQLMGYGLQAEDFDQYRNSEYYYATPAETIFFLLFNGYETEIAKREAAADFDATTTDLQTQMLESFRRACAVSIDRELMAATVSPARKGGYAFLGDTYIYDPETCAYYRDTDQAKMALVDFYSIDLDDYNGDLDAAVDSITGLDPVTAKEKFAEAYQEALDLGYVTDNDGDGLSDQTVTMVYAMSGEMSEFYRKTLDFLNSQLNAGAAGTGFEGKILITPSAPVGNAWSDNIRNGQMDTQLAGWSGGSLDPFGTALTWTDPAQAYWGNWWDANNHDMTVNIDGTDVTMSIRDFALALNGTPVTVDGVEYNYGYGVADTEVRLDILAEIERQMLVAYNCVPIMQDAGGSLLSQQIYHVVEDYNPMLSRGGIQYDKYNYNEEEWAAYVASQGGSLQY